MLLGTEIKKEQSPFIILYNIALVIVHFGLKAFYGHSVDYSLQCFLSSIEAFTLGYSAESKITLETNWVKDTTSER